MVAFAICVHAMSTLSTKPEGLGKVTAALDEFLQGVGQHKALWA